MRRELGEIGLPKKETNRFGRAEDFALLARSIGLAHHCVRDATQFSPVLEQAFAQRGPVLVEVDMLSVGPYPVAFAGPPVRESGASQ